MVESVENAAKSRKKKVEHKILAKKIAPRRIRASVHVSWHFVYKKGLMTSKETTV